jgi:hypothetical protein
MAFYIDMVPLQSLQGGLSSSSSLCGVDHLVDSPQRNICHHIKNFQSDLQVETNYLYNLLSDLRNYYKTIKTCHQLNLEVPAGFRESSNHVKQLCHYLSKMHSDSLDPPVDPLISSLSLNIIDDNNVIVDDITDTKKSSPTIDIPIIRSVDKPSSSLPQHITMSEDYIRAALGFRRIDTLKTHFKDLYQDIVKIDSLPADAVLDAGDLSTIRKTARNTTPVPRPSYFGDVFHVDIIFGPEITIGNIHYGLLFRDHYSRMTYLYPLQNLTSDIPNRCKHFMHTLVASALSYF